MWNDYSGEKKPEEKRTRERIGEEKIPEEERIEEKRIEEERAGEEAVPEKDTEGKHVFRHELKYRITDWQRKIIAERMGCFLSKDAHVQNGVYTIRSLYFDDGGNTAYEEKLMGTADRRKYRIRCYNYSDRTIRLECKNKQGSYIYKEAAPLSREDTERIIAGDYSCLAGRGEPVCRNFYYQCVARQMRPRVVVDYERIPFVFSPGDVRITFDCNIREAVLMGSFFDEGLPTFGVTGPDELIMEVKFTAFLPEFIRDILTTQEADYVAASKYVMCCESKIRRVGALI